MKYTLQELAAAVGCAFYPQRWNDFFEEVMTAYDAGGCRYSDPDYYERLEKEYGCFGEKYWPVSGLRQKRQRRRSRWIVFWR